MKKSLNIKKKRELGLTISSGGGLFVILGTFEKLSFLSLVFTILGVIFSAIGLYIILKNS